MRVSDAFPKKFIASEDLQGQRVTLTVSHVNMEEVGDSDNKPVMYFTGKQKGMVLNKTNANQMSYMYGDETDLWAGKQVELFTQMVEFQGRPVPGLRIAPPPNQPMTSQPMPDGRPTLEQPPQQTNDGGDPKL